MTLVDTLAAGGAERLAVELACALDPTEFRASVVATKRGGVLEARLADAGVTHTILGRRHLLSPRAALAALRLSRESDLIHSHLFGNNVWGALLARGAGIPLVAHEHNRVARHVPFESMLDRFLIAPAAARVLCVSESSAAELRAAGLRRAVIDVVPNGVQLDAALPRAAARAALGLADDDLVVGAVASLRPEKGHDVLLRAFRMLLDLDRYPRLKLCIIGEGVCGGALRELAHRLGIDRQVRFAGARSDAPHLQKAFDVAVVASRSEGLPLAALESLAAGTPLVATRVGALPEVLDGGAGILVEPGESSALAAAIRAVLDDPERSSMLAAAGPRRVAERYAFARTVQAVTDTYRAVLAAGRGAFLDDRSREEAKSGSRVENFV